MCCPILQDACAIQYVSESGGSGKLQGASIVLTGAAGIANNNEGSLDMFFIFTIY